MGKPARNSRGARLRSADSARGPRGVRGRRGPPGHGRGHRQQRGNPGVGLGVRRGRARRRAPKPAHPARWAPICRCRTSRRTRWSCWMSARSTGLLPSDAPIDFEAIEKVYVAGVNSVNSDCPIRTIAGFARTERDEAIWNDYTGYFGDQTWLDAFVMSAIQGTGAFAGESDLVRRQGIQKGIQNQIMVAWTPHEVIAALGKAGDGNFVPPPARRTTGTRAGRSTTAPTPTVARTPPPTAVAATSAPARRSTTPSRRPSPRASRRSSTATPQPPRRRRTRSCGRSRSPTCRRRSATPTSSTATSAGATPARPASTRPRAGRSTACSSRSSRGVDADAAATIASYYDLAAGAPKAGAGEAVQSALESVYAGLGISAGEIGTLQ